jgi:hypothetical protein
VLIAQQYIGCGRKSRLTRSCAWCTLGVWHAAIKTNASISGQNRLMACPSIDPHPAIPNGQMETKQEQTCGRAPRFLSLWRGEIAIPPRSMASVAGEVAARHGLALEALRTPTRSRPIAHARQEAMAAMRQVRRPDGRVRYSHGQIARFFGLSRHSTVIYAIKALRRRAEPEGAAR